MPENLIAGAASAYAYPLLVKQLLTNSLEPLRRPGDHLPRRAPLHLPRFPPPHRPARLRARGARRPARLDRRGHGLGQPPLPRELLRDPDDGRDALHRERPALAAADRLHPERLGGGGRARARRLRAGARGHEGRAEGRAQGRGARRRPGRRRRTRCRSRASTRRSSAPHRQTSSSATSTRTPRRRPSTRPARPAIRRACTTATARSSCTRSRRR